MFSDHNCYYNDLSPLVKLGSKLTDYESGEVYNIPFMIYSPKLEAQKIDTFCSTYDIYPTICELYGLEYNKNLTQGYSVFSPEIEESIFVSFTSGIFDNKLYTNNILEVTNYSDEILTEDEIFEFQLRAAKFYEKQNKIDGENK